MEQTRAAMTQHLAERWCWQVAHRDDARVARRLYRTPVVDGVYRLDEGALLDDFFSCWHELGIVDWLDDVPGPAVQRERVPCLQSLLLDSVQTLLGLERMPAVPALRCSDEALMRLVGFNAHQVRSGVCQRGAPRTGRGRASQGPSAQTRGRITS